MSASEAYQASTISPHVMGIETESFLILSKISEQKELLDFILKKYDAISPEYIESMIEQGEIEEHPAYENYLSALSYEQNIKDLQKELKIKGEELEKLQNYDELKAITNLNNDIKELNRKLSKIVLRDETECKSVV